MRFKEFSQEVVNGREPSLTLVVPDVICGSCQSVVDIDICRTEYIYEDTAQEIPSAVWRCMSCEGALDKN